MNGKREKAASSLCWAAGLASLAAISSGCLRQNPAYDPLAGDGGEADVVNCSDGRCGQHAGCDDRGGRAVCVCDDGYAGDGIDCADVDECKDGTHDCGEHAVCSNTEGGFGCACEAGYTGNGYSCLDIDECQIHTDLCDDAVESCANTAGGHDCLCNFEGCDDGCCAEGEVCHAVDHNCCLPGACEVGGALSQDDGCGGALDCAPWTAIPGGSFTMGSAAIGAWTAPEHGVTVPDFELWRTEVTVVQYGDCVTNGPCTPPAECGTAFNWGVSGRERHPVNCVTWDQAVKYCNWVGGRLPSESEWEWAASNGSAEEAYPWGADGPACVRVVYKEDSPAEGSGCEGEGAQPVCSRSPLGDNDNGICDLAGNVWEWVEDDYFGYGTGYLNAPADGSAWVANPRASTRIIRGGSFGDPAEFLPAAYRADMDPGSFDPGVGFRCARDAD